MKNLPMSLPIQLRMLLFGMCFIGSSTAQDLCQPVGWATQNGGVSGGGNATAVTTTTYNDFKSALTSSSQKVIYVKGTITVPAGGMITIQDLSGKSIIGLPGSKIISTDMSSSGSGILYIKRCKNFILRNLVFEGPGAYDVDGNDNLCIDNCQNFWVDHCEFHDGMDGNFDIKNMSDFISATWCTFSYEKTPRSGGSGGADDHRYSNLIGSSDNATDDANHLNITFYYCWWGAGCRERMPRMRFGKLHMVNNLFSSSVSNHCIRAGYKANILAVGNYFNNQKLPIDEYEGNYTAIKAYDNYGASTLTKNTAFTPPYSLPIAPAADIVTPIKSCAGATLDNPDGCSSCGGTTNKKPVIALTAPADHATFDAPASITINASATDEDGSVSKVEFYNGTSLLSSDLSSPYSYSWQDVAPGTYTLTAVATDNEGATVTSSAITVNVNNPDIPSLSSTDNLLQVVDSGATITPIVFTWGGAATDVNYTTLPEGLVASKNGSAKNLTISGIPAAGGTFSVSTIGGDPEVTLEATLTIQAAGVLLAAWYPFQEDPVSLTFVSFTDASIDVSYLDQEKPDNGVAYTPGALRLNKGTGTLTISLQSLDALKIRWYTTGGRTLKITYGPTGTEHTWNSPNQYESGAHELDLTSLIPDLVSATPVIVNIINDRTDGGSLNIHDLFVEGTKLPATMIKGSTRSFGGKKSLTCTTVGHTLLFPIHEHLPVNTSQTIAIINLRGQTVAIHNFSPVIDIRRLRNGVYFLKTGNFKGTFIKK